MKKRAVCPVAWVTRPKEKKLDCLKKKKKKKNSFQEVVTLSLLI
jgi:hypothetical protein